MRKGNEDLQELIQNIKNGKRRHVFLLGDCRELLRGFPKNFIDCVITSPPYWKMREYEINGEYKHNLIGNEENPKQYVNNLVEVFFEIKRILKPSGSVWLNIGDKYQNKNLMGMPWRVALALQDEGWILRNDVIWHQMKGTQSSKDRLRMVHEHFFHFVKNKKYYYDHKQIRIKPKKSPTFNNGRITSATGVSGVKYRKQILESEHLTNKEKKAAIKTLENVLQEMKDGKIVDFRMTIRGRQRTLHSNNGKISGRAKELTDKGFYIIKSSSRGYIPNDVWQIVPEDEWRSDTHYAVFPVELLKVPIKATCPKNGIILDPFMGIGSAIVAAKKFGRRGIGIDISEKYIKIAKKRLKGLQQPLIFT